MYVKLIELTEGSNQLQQAQHAHSNNAYGTKICTTLHVSYKSDVSTYTPMQGIVVLVADTLHRLFL